MTLRRKGGVAWAWLILRAVTEVRLIICNRRQKLVQNDTNSQRRKDVGPKDKKSWAINVTRRNSLLYVINQAITLFITVRWLTQKWIEKYMYIVNELKSTKLDYYLSMYRPTPIFRYEATLTVVFDEPSIHRKYSPPMVNMSPKDDRSGNN